ncbi:MAG: cation diffusion facilitator family transporter [Planctomycetaceae bacterium]|jgi:cation diffusion facilitator family transporter|nr:cation diffusion facilitator family transporter [Planctomycetaceae bacterium]
MAQASMERKATRVAVIVAVVLLFTKLLAYRLTGSTAVFGDAMESLVNVVASLLAVWSVWMAHRPADRTHPYGHGKAEFVSAAIEGGLVLAAAGAVAFKCVNDFGAAEQPLQSIDMGLLLLASTVLVNGVVGGWLLHLGKSGGSAALEADGIHLLSDAWTSGGAIISLILVRASGMQWIDPVIALLMAAWLVWCGWRVVRRSLGNLMDEQDLGDLDRVQKLLDQHCRDGGTVPRVCSFHKVRSRHSGREHWVDFHVQLPANTDLRTAHELATQLEDEIERTLGGTATAHAEPCKDAACTNCHRAA